MYIMLDFYNLHLDIQWEFIRKIKIYLQHKSYMMQYFAQFFKNFVIGFYHEKYIIKYRIFIVHAFYICKKKIFSNYDSI